MGCDGGTIPRRDELVRTKKKPEQKDRNSEMAFKWKHCAISQEVLVKPIVACELGRLYNKETVLEFLLDKTKFELASGFEHIKGLKDVKQLNLTDNPARPAGDPKKGDGTFIDTGVSDFICPVVGLEMSGKYRFCFIWSCGCVVSEKALKEIKSETCQKCGKTYDKEDVIVLNGTDDEVEYFLGRMMERRAKAKALKRVKKAKKERNGDPEEAGPSTSKKALIESAESSSSPLVPASVNGKDHPSNSKLNGHYGKSKLLPAVKGASNGKLTKNGKLTSEKDKKKNGTHHTIQDDPNSSKTYKSLFTTSAAEKLQEKPHWITFNPQYF